MKTDYQNSSRPKTAPRPVYFDNNATTPLDPEVLRAMQPYLEEEFGNASSKNHSYGWKAEMGVEKARKQVAQLLNCDSKEIYWTSGATESNNMVILGLAQKFMGEAVHIITSNVEHKAVLEVCLAARYFGAEVTVLEADRHGRIELNQLKAALRPETRLISLMGANNEIGSINPIEELAAFAAEKGIAFHCDGAQAVGKFPIDLQKWKVNFLSLSGHKIYGPKGVGALFIRAGSEELLRPLFFGGSQEKGIRPGTLNVAGLVGLGRACELCGELMESERQRLGRFQKELIEKITALSKDILLNGHPTERLCNNVSFSIKNLSADVFALGLGGLALSSGSACTSGSASPSHVLMALGLDEGTARSTLRLGTGRFTREADIQLVITKITQMIEKNKEISNT
jgi:cysteine desulfurase